MGQHYDFSLLEQFAGMWPVHWGQSELQNFGSCLMGLFIPVIKPWVGVVRSDLQTLVVCTDTVLWSADIGLVNVLSPSTRQRQPWCSAPLSSQMNLSVEMSPLIKCSSLMHDTWIEDASVQQLKRHSEINISGKINGILLADPIRKMQWG